MVEQGTEQGRVYRRDYCRHCGSRRDHWWHRWRRSRSCAWCRHRRRGWTGCLLGDTWPAPDSAGGGAGGAEAGFERAAAGEAPSLCSAATLPVSLLRLSVPVLLWPRVLNDHRSNTRPGDTHVARPFCCYQCKQELAGVLLLHAASLASMTLPDTIRRPLERRCRLCYWIYLWPMGTYFVGYSGPIYSARGRMRR